MFITIIICITLMIAMIAIDTIEETVTEKENIMNKSEFATINNAVYIPGEFEELMQAADKALYAPIDYRIKYTDLKFENDIEDNIEVEETTFDFAIYDEYMSNYITVTETRYSEDYPCMYTFSKIMFATYMQSYNALKAYMGNIKSQAKTTTKQKTKVAETVIAIEETVNSQAEIAALQEDNVVEEVIIANECADSQAEDVDSQAEDDEMEEMLYNKFDFLFNNEKWIDAASAYFDYILYCNDGLYDNIQNYKSDLVDDITIIVTCFESCNATNSQLADVCDHIGKSFDQDFVDDARAEYVVKVWNKSLAAFQKLKSKRKS